MKTFRNYLEDFALRDGTPAKKIKNSTLNVFFIRDTKQDYNTTELFFGFWKTEGNITLEEIYEYILNSTEPQFQNIREKFRWKDHKGYAMTQIVTAVQAMDLQLHYNLALQSKVINMKQNNKKMDISDYYNLFKNFPKLIEKGESKSIAWETIKGEIEKLFPKTK